MQERFQKLAKEFQDKLIKLAVKLHGGEQFIVPDITEIRSAVDIGFRISQDGEKIEVIDWVNGDKLVATVPISKESITIKSDQQKKSILEIKISPDLIKFIKENTFVKFVTVSNLFRNQVLIAEIINKLEIKKH